MRDVMSSIFYHLKELLLKDCFQQGLLPKKPLLKIVLSQQIDSLESPLKTFFHRLTF